MKIEKLYKIYQSFPFIVTDTREIKKDCIFFSLKGEKFNGNKFAKDAIEKLEAGADLIQVYTGFIYEGPSLIKDINKTIIKKLTT